ncbi:MAG: Cohesin domain protein [Candidatus Argoarchaeum ethanivorans]|uniref:Cohesin domain protein n=1 Tax=Candidatus Argoarchaeum ethanivorans TaxID=2608793 RepID=A0A811T7C7_9EURY|nr:MAG: Cohesin domain protein [Candidatus Argoarchaeum ethanivorans]
MEDKKMKTKASIGVVGIAVFLVLVGAVSAVDATTVSVEPATQTVKSGDSFSVDINITDVTYMGMDQALLNFDPTAMQATGIVEGDFLKSAGTTSPYTGIDNTAGTAIFCYSLQTQGVGVSGNGTLATINFDTIPEAECTFDLTLTNILLADGNGDPITVDVTVDGEVKLDNTPPTVDITAPEDGHWFDSEDVVISFHPWDNKADMLNYSIYDDGVEVANGTAANCSNKEVNLGVLTECDHVINVTVEDYAGKTNSSEVTIHVDLYPPTVDIMSPGQGLIYPNLCARLNFTAADPGVCPSGINWTAYSLDGGANVTITGNTTIEITTPCDHTLIVYAKDEVGKENSSAVTFALWPGDVYEQAGQTGKVNGFDLQRLAWAFMSEPGDPNWNERADLKCDNVVNGFDLQRLAWNFMNDYTVICGPV